MTTVTTKMAISLLIFSSMILYISPLVAMAGDTSAHPKVRWKQIVEAVNRHPILKQQMLKNQMSQAIAETAQAIPNPTMELSVARGKGKETDNTALEWGAAITIPLDWMATRSSDTRAANVMSTVNESDQVLLRQEVIAKLRRLFWRSVYQREKKQRLEQLLTQTTSLSQLIQKRVESGDARPTELTRILIEQEKVALALTEAQMEMTALQAELSLWINTEQPIYCDASLAFTQNKPPQATSSRVETHASLEKLRRQVSATDARIHAAKRHRFPELALTVFAESELDKTALGAGVELSVPLWNFNNGNIHHEMAKKAFQHSEIEIQQRALERLRLRTNASCRSSFYQANEFKQRVLPKVTEVSAKMERAYVLGEATLLDVLDARRSVLSAQTELLDAQLRARLDCSDVYALTGEEKK